MDDRKIIDLYLSRSEDAITETDKKYGKTCRRLSENIVGSRDDALECVNDTYLAVWNSIPPTEPDPFSAFLFRITRNLSLKKYRFNTAEKRNSHYDSSLDELAEAVGDENSVLSDDTRITSELIESFLDGLSRENRVIFIRRYWFSDSYTEISKRLAISEKSVSMRLTRMRKNLKKYLEKEGITV